MDKKIIFAKTVAEKVGCSRQTIWRYIEANKFPKPIKIEQRNAWLESTIDQWIDEKMGGTH